MSKVITSPVKRWPGTVTLSSPLNYPQAIALETAINAAGALPDDAGRLAYEYALLPAILGCVEGWKLEGLPEQIGNDNFPATPRISSARLLSWLIEQVMSLYAEADESPNE